jgi:hypothetical protein
MWLEKGTGTPLGGGTIAETIPSACRFKPPPSLDPNSFERAPPARPGGIFLTFLGFVSCTWLCFPFCQFVNCPRARGTSCESAPQSHPRHPTAPHPWAHVACAPSSTPRPRAHAPQTSPRQQPPRRPAPAPRSSLGRRPARRSSPAPRPRWLSLLAAVVACCCSQHAGMQVRCCYM